MHLFRFGSVLAASACAAYPTPVTAQSDPSAGIEELIVTARKREETLQETPLSISALSAAGLEARGIRKVNEIEDITPNLSFYDSSAIGAASNSASIFVRGIGQSDFVPTAEPGVGLYVDGVYVGRTVGGVLDLLDVERIEVLRGPQGTLFGRNSIGGVVSIVSKKPADAFAVQASATTGTDDRLDAAVTVDAPIGANLKTKLAVASFSQDGYVRNTSAGQRLGDDDTTAARAALRWTPSPSTVLDVSLDYSRDRENGIPYTSSGTVFVDPTQPGGPNFAFISNVLAGSITGCDGTFDNPAGSLTNSACLNDQYLGTNGGRGDFHSNVDVYGAAVSVGWYATDRLELRSITGYRRLDSDFAYDGDATPVFIVDGLRDEMTQRQVTQELQLVGTSLDDALEWILGVYDFQEDGKDVNPVDFLPVSLRSGGYYDNQSSAVFGQATYRFTPKLELTAGARHTDDTKHFLPDQVVTGGLVTLGVPGFPTIPVGTRVLPFEEVRTRSNAWTPLVNLAYAWSDSLATYVTYAEGYKGGGFHQRVFPPLPETPVYDPELATSYEIGFKYASAERDFVLNGSAFTTDYDNMQVTVYTAIAPVIDNAGNARISGLELESRWIPAEGWRVETSVGYLHTTYTNVLPTTGLTGDERLPFVPEWKASASLARDVPFAAGTLTPRIDWSYASDVAFDTFNTPLIVGGDYRLWNASATWRPSSARWTIAVRGANLTDERYARRRVFSESFGNVLDYLDRGRQWSVTAKLQF